MRWIALNAQPVVGDDGRAEAVVSTLSDVAERRVREGLVSRLGRILEHSRDEVCVLDSRNLRLVQVNRSVVANTGYRAGRAARA